MLIPFLYKLFEIPLYYQYGALFSGIKLQFISICSFKKKHFIYLKSRVNKEREGERENFHPLVHSPNVHSSRGWAKPKLGVRSFIQVSHRGDRSPRTWTISRCFLRCMSWEVNWKCCSWNCNWHPNGLPALQMAT